MTPHNCIIAVDIGTTSAKAILYQIGNRIIAQDSRNYPSFYPQPEIAEQDPDQVLKAVVAVIREVVLKGGINSKLIEALVFTGIWQSLLPVDDNGCPLAKALLWADSRSLGQCERLKIEVNSEELKARTGCSIHPMYYPSRLAWFKEHAAEIYQKTYKFISIKEYVLYHLFGQFKVDKSIASGTGMFHMAAANWDEELLHYLGLSPQKLAPVVETTAMFDKGLKPQFASQMGLIAGTPGVIGAADGALAHLGAVGLSSKRMSLTVGTGAALRLRVDHPQILPGTEAWCYYMTENQWLLGGVVQDAGNVLSWYGDNFMDEGRTPATIYDTLNRYARQIQPGAEGLIFLPFLSGERCPNNRPDARGALYGFKFGHTRRHFARALMEGLSYRLFSVYKMLASQTEPDLVVTGGLLKSPVWLKIMADFFGKRFWIPKMPESAAWGAILVALRSLGILKELEQVNALVEVESAQEPDPEAHRQYQHVYESYHSLYTKLFGDL